MTENVLLPERQKKPNWLRVKLPVGKDFGSRDSKLYYLWTIVVVEIEIDE